MQQNLSTRNTVKEVALRSLIGKTHTNRLTEGKF